MLSYIVLSLEASITVIDLGAQMDDSGHRENGRHNPLQRPWHMQHQPSIGQIMAAMAERDAALQERNLAFSEKKAALAERDLAILQRNSAILERNSAIMARDKAISTLQHRKNAMTLGVKHEHQPHHYRPHTDETPYDSSDIHISGPLKMSPVPSETKKQTKEAKAATHNKKPSKISKRVKREKEEGDEMGLNQVAFHGNTMPVPFAPAPESYGRATSGEMGVGSRPAAQQPCRCIPCRRCHTSGMLGLAGGR
ncbi:hypothetical protein C3L33_09474, partial [Rhododendron williamsianum]